MKFLSTSYSIDARVALSNTYRMITATRRLTAMIWEPIKQLYLARAVLVVFLTITPLMYFASMGGVVNALGNGGAGLVWSLSLLIVASLLPAVIQPVNELCTKFLYYRISEQLDANGLRKRQEIDPARYDDPACHDLFVRTDHNSFKVLNFTERQFDMLESFLSVVLSLSVILVGEWWVSLLLLAGTLPRLIVEARFGDAVWGIWASGSEVVRRYWNVRHHLTNPRATVETKLFGMGDKFINLFLELMESFRAQERKAQSAKLKLSLLSALVAQVTFAIAAGWFVYKVSVGKLAVGSFVFIMGAVTSFTASLSNLFIRIGQHYADLKFAEDFLKLLDLPKLLPVCESPVPLSSESTPVITFDSVSFCYPGATTPALSNVNLTFTPGEKVAIVGENGAGKSTLVKLLCRFYDPTEGKILVDGVDLRELDLKEWHGVLGCLFQSFENYQFPVKDTIAFGRVSHPLDLERVKESAEASEASAFIDKWPKQYDQMVGKHFTGGVEPSGGQYQRLALARVFYRAPRIFILDEPTSAMDAEAEERMFESLEKLSSDKTVLLISHRFSTVRKADRIIVFGSGGVIESGSHGELMEQDGTYAKLFKLQAQGYQ